MNNVNNIWLKKPWKNNNNKDLCYCVSQEQDRFNLTPPTIHNLDRVGLNELEILNVDGCLGKRIRDLPVSDIELLSMLEEKYEILFNGDERLLFNDGKMNLTTLLNKPLNNMYYAKIGGDWHGTALLYSINARSYFLNLEAA